MEDDVTKAATESKYWTFSFLFCFSATHIHTHTHMQNKMRILKSGPDFFQKEDSSGDLTSHVLRFQMPKVVRN